MVFELELVKLGVVGLAVFFLGPTAEQPHPSARVWKLFFEHVQLYGWCRIGQIPWFSSMAKSLTTD